jgi:hypothetical protein
MKWIALALTALIVGGCASSQRLGPPAQRIYQRPEHVPQQRPSTGGPYERDPNDIPPELRFVPETRWPEPRPPTDTKLA